MKAKVDRASWVGLVVSSKDDFPKEKTADLSLKCWVQLNGTILYLLAPESCFSTCFKETEGKLGRRLPGVISTDHTEDFSSSSQPHPRWTVGSLTYLDLPSWAVLDTRYPQRSPSESLLSVTANLPAASRGTDLFLGLRSGILGIIPWPCTGGNAGCGKVRRR